MNAAQMEKEFEIAYESIASSGAPGYEAYEKSILLTQAQNDIIKELVASGAERDDIRALVIGPHIKTDTFSGSVVPSTMYPTAAVFEKDVSDMWLIVNERVKETSSSTPLEVKPVEHTFLDANLSNPYKKPQTGRHFWRLLQYGETTELFTTPNFVIIGLSDFDTYYINYLERPTPIMVPATVGTIDGVTAGSSVVVSGMGTVTITASGLSCAFNSLIHRDIVKRAAQLGAAYVSDPESFQLLMNSYNRT